MTSPAAAVSRDLIFDVGVGNGDDSAYYMREGFRVVGVEANPLLIPRLRERFAGAIDEGRYELVAVGIAEQEGAADFWVCDDRAEWSSFDRSIAGRLGSRHHAVRVATCRFASILQRFGTPYFCKLDIEGNEDLCLSDLASTQAAVPPYISVELSDPERQILRLSDLGYDRFKIISQRTLRQPGGPITAIKSTLPRLSCRLITALEVALTRHGTGGRKHARGSSGPFGEQAHGCWRSAGEALDACHRISAITANYDEWFDIHASLGEAS